MNKIRLKYIAGFVIGALLFGCNTVKVTCWKRKYTLKKTVLLLKPRVMMSLPVLAGETFFQKFLADRGNL